MNIQVFISYRRDGGDTLAQLLYDRLTKDGYRVFLDVESLRSGKLNKAIYSKIEECTDFLLILPEHGLDRCKNEDDWVRLEIEYAIKLKKNIIPVNDAKLCISRQFAKIFDRITALQWHLCKYGTV